MHTTEAWVLSEGPDGGAAHRATLERTGYSFPEITPEEVLAEPIYGCWEANMYHALARDPVDVCRQRGEPRVVVGNGGVVRVRRVGAAVTTCAPGDLCVVFPNAVADRHGYMVKAYAYDAPDTVGLLARTTKMPGSTLIPIPAGSRFSLRRWAAFSLRYITAWANWRVAHACWRSQLTEADMAAPYVWAWGGGVALAELTLARAHGAVTAMASARPERLARIAALGIEPIDRRTFDGLHFDASRYRCDRAYRDSYRDAEGRFLDLVRERTGGDGVSIFVDNIGGPVYRATLKAVGREGVVATCGWRHGMELTTIRATECIRRHIHAHTHYARYQEGLAAVDYAERTGWLPPEPPVWAWEDVNDLAALYHADQIHDYFALYRVNPEPGATSPEGQT